MVLKLTSIKGIMLSIYCNKNKYFLFNIIFNEPLLKWLCDKRRAPNLSKRRQRLLLRWSSRDASKITTALYWMQGIVRKNLKIFRRSLIFEIEIYFEFWYLKFLFIKLVWLKHILNYFRTLLLGQERLCESQRWKFRWETKMDESGYKW